ncbi:MULTISPECIES: protein-glutamate methylesterase/protein-glutamine glutaminase [Halomicrobium]|uniref:Protein-glutamate methylesterase/protein-glutamine glutaminase n=2 Tax=Halomicrobium mukohataei TaxID=57705 RepID=C7NX20_HALMD|nr:MULTISPECIES: chemotaxis response regulator protein-glutamate methylesterase [Halomicrobium]ACV46385.1 response regulator receiver modulated CheB methylesterase [Halomicrobium mukohataei DSM 12286]QCD64938.1 chemotaxis response regulator protein-glutamate methylesterase [Halomicrobium mukohataei]QFR19744.1 chemotaxis-specific protein-glutamate methyltransferase CheB [Halomicrobium sp. ZPS1]
MAGSTPRAVVADDSHFMRSVISDILDEGGVDVVAEAKNGREAVALVDEHRPDVVTMDVEMPEMDGISAVEQIMEQCPTPVLMLSAHTDENADVTFEALDVGAVDFFTKPGGEVSMEMSRLKDQLLEMVLSVADVDVSGTSGRTPTASPNRSPTSTPEAVADDYDANPTLIIGSSTGGPKMVESVLSELPLAADFRVLVVQHMPGGFTGRFAQRIDARSDYDVREAQDGDRISGGEALIAAGDYHLRVKNYRNGRLRVKLSDDPPVNSVRPAVDVTMETAADVIDDPLVGVILTGMGNDGAAGIERIKAAGGRTIAQDEATSAVYGMPQRAAETGCVDSILPIEEIPAGIVETIKREVT